MDIINRIWKRRWLLRAFFPSLLFNFKHLPLYQACHLPILLYKADIRNNSGKFIITGPVRFGMIRLGVKAVSLFPNNGIMIENRGTIIFSGKTNIGNNSAISLGNAGILKFGDHFIATTGLKLACYHSISFDRNVLIGWNVQIVDTDFHALRNVNSGGKGYGAIKIGHDVWIANGCKIYKNVSIPDSCVVGADTILHNAVACPPYCLIINKIETSIKAIGAFHDRNDDKIEYSDKES